MDFRIEPVSISDKEEIIDIFNHYIENSFAAYPEDKVPYEFFSLIPEHGGRIPLPRGQGWRGKSSGLCTAPSSQPHACILQNRRYYLFHQTRAYRPGDRKGNAGPPPERGQGEGHHLHNGKHLISELKEPELSQEARFPGVRPLPEGRSKMGPGLR